MDSLDIMLGEIINLGTHEKLKVAVKDTLINDVHHPEPRPARIPKSTSFAATW